MADIECPATLLKKDLVNKYARTKMTIFVGKAASHCVRKTIADVVNNINSKDRKKLVVLN